MGSTGLFLFQLTLDMNKTFKTWAIKSLQLPFTNEVKF